MLTDHLRAKTSTGTYIVRWLEKSKLEANSFLSPMRYYGLVDLLKGLEEFGGLRASSDLDIVEDNGLFFVQERGGIFGLINLRIFFHPLPELGVLVVLGVRKKDVDSPNALGDHILMQCRCRLAERLLGATGRKLAAIEPSK